MKKIITVLVLLLFPFIVLAYTNENNAKIIITDNEKSINEYFNLGSDVTTNWSVEDASVASIVNNKIIPIKVGTTDIKSEINGDTYILHLEVTNEETSVVTKNKDINSVMQDVSVTNPKTGDEVVLLAMVILLSFVTIIFFRVRMGHGKYEEE